MKTISLKDYLLTLDDDTQKCISSLINNKDPKISISDIQDFRS